jgi:prepilin-type N-terminal cleavage/methylation domain-containing protein
MKYKKIMQKGFTLIELLVVIAIIGILSSVVLASLNTARGKGSDAAAKEDLNNIRAQAELQYDQDLQIYSNVCTNANVVQAIKAASSAEGGSWTAVAGNSNSATGAGCVSSNTAWIAWITLAKGALSPNTFCVDSTGVSFIKTTLPGTSAPTTCGSSATVAW